MKGWPKHKPIPMPDQFAPLAAYNAERARGLVHTPEWHDRMHELQHEYNRWYGGGSEDHRW
jgi:hypothetical protein